MAETTEQDLYVVLGLPGGVDGANVAEKDLRKAYRKRAFECHPDKRPKDAAAAAAEFLRVQHAYDVLSDGVARKAYDELQLLRKLREEKHQMRDVKRQKMMRDLQQAEAAHEQVKQQKARESNAAARLKVEIERMRAKKAAERSSRLAEVSRQSHSWLDERDKQNSLKVTWDSSADYSAQKLRDIFTPFGGVEDVMILCSKSKKKGRAVVIMDSPAAVYAATQSQCGDLSNPLLVKPLVFTTSTPSVQPPGQKSQQQQEQQTLAGAGYQKREDSVLAKLRKQAEEKKRAQRESTQSDSQQQQAQSNSQQEPQSGS